MAEILPSGVESTEVATVDTKFMAKTNPTPNTNTNANVSLQGCFDKNWLLQSNSEDALKDFICLICKQIANNPVQLECSEHGETEEPEEYLIVGKYCLERHLKNNNEKCPVEEHQDCKYHNVQPFQAKIGNLDFICLRQYELNKQSTSQSEKKCNFIGKKQALKKHLEGSCILASKQCYFKEFGCDILLCESNEDEHMKSHLKEHLKLVKLCVDFWKLQVNKRQEATERVRLENMLLKKKTEFE